MPSSEQSKTAEAQEVQRSASKRATLDLLRSKKRKEKELVLVINDEEATFLLRSISAKEYDKLVTDSPPNAEQRAAGSSYNINRFAPKLMSKVIVDPEISEEQWGEIWASPDWNRGELMSLFGEAVDICNVGLRLGPTATG